ncbi:hypothetical protein GCM10009601_55910 [Streptomyces thermospinosisporus]|uniref:Mersacidin/lichenicidin family type 2 lantibiotic n=1 Tax=Streptomyces thermospinosisporus TaxID=161482 RepID=A0ABP4JWR3_9ACTN
MASEAKFTAEESRKLAAFIARAWADPALAEAYRRDPRAVLSGAGIDLGGRDVPDLPDKPGDLGSQPLNDTFAISSSASSISCATCPCTGCTASCACVAESAEVLDKQLGAVKQLAEDPGGREYARALMSKWNVKVGR